MHPDRKRPGRETCVRDEPTPREPKLETVNTCSALAFSPERGCCARAWRVELGTVSSAATKREDYAGPHAFARREWSL